MGSLPEAPPGIDRPGWLRTGACQLAVGCRSRWNWRVRAAHAPVEWSVSLNHNILWRTPLPNGGQSRIAVWGDRLFPTTFDDYRVGDPKFSASIQGHCLDARTGKLLSARHR